MKNLSTVALVAWLAPWACFAQILLPAGGGLVTGPEADNGGSFYAGLAAALAAPLQSQGTLYQWGAGGDLSGGYAFNDNVAVQMQLDNLYFSRPQPYSAYSLCSLAELRLSLDLDEFQPYVLLGPGLNFHFMLSNLKPATAVNFATVIGLGGLMPVSDDASFYVEGKYVVTYYNPSPAPLGEVSQDIPMEAGLLLDL